MCSTSEPPYRVGFIHWSSTKFVY
uniref:Uncharacterized protein n=1 Tax=Rhizophora mucronata TaxID=61149 RepID=A0A2P2QKU7_RHIMU